MRAVALARLLVLVCYCSSAHPSTDSHGLRPIGSRIVVEKITRMLGKEAERMAQ